MTSLSDYVPDTVQATAEAFRQEADAQYTRLRSNPDLSASAMRTGMAKAYVAAAQKLKGLQEASAGQVAAQRDDAMRKAFGAPSADPMTAISARDAGDRAAQLDSDDWQTGRDLLQRAILNYDDSMAAAIGRRAYELSNTYGLGSGGGQGGWADVLAAYLEYRPAAAAALDTLASLQQTKPTIASVAAFWVPPPSELAGLDQWQIEALAGQ